ncbi:MAG: hypothetical protein MUE85_02455 [Microscillaceae bacterium]|jgi:hypothetical protein|nr:hypothetical protein [Microscillaceae bacterium]
MNFINTRHKLSGYPEIAQYDFQYLNDKGKIELPMSATYAADRQGIVRKHFIEISPVKRLDPQNIVDFLQ